MLVVNITSKIVRAYPWIPIGETMPSVISKVQHLNRLNAVAIRSIFSKSKNYPFNSKYSSQAIHPSIFDFNKISQHTGWKESDFKASFPLFLIEYSSNLKHQYKLIHGARDLDKTFHLADKIRVCDECYVNGYHLLFHQSTEWKLCPIHLKALSTKCPTCGSELNQYGVDLDLGSSFVCQQCGNGLIDSTYKADIEFQKDVQRIVKEYSAHSISLQHQLKIKNEVITEPSNYHQFVQLLTAYNGPSWIKKCLYNNNQKKNLFSTKSSEIKTNIESENATLDSESISKNSYEKQLLSTLRLSLIEAEKRICSSFYWIDKSLHPTHTYWKRVSLSYSGINSVSMAYSIIKEEVEEHLVDTEIFQSSVQCAFWAAWRNDVKKYVDTQHLTMSQNIDLTMKLSKLWFTSVLLTMYKYMVIKSYFAGYETACEFTYGEIYGSMERHLGKNMVFRKGSDFYVIDMYPSLKALAKIVNEEADKQSCRKLNIAFGTRLVESLTASESASQDLLQLYIKSCE